MLLDKILSKNKVRSNFSFHSRFNDQDGSLKFQAKKNAYERRVKSPSPFPTSLNYVNRKNEFDRINMENNR
jgi:hypothetical protein